MTDRKTLKNKLYENYVSSGQAADISNNQDVFSGRSFYIKHVIKNHFSDDKTVTIGDLG